jgi:hypothetical protein
VELDPQLLFKRMADMNVAAANIADLGVGVSAARISRIRNGAERIDYLEYRGIEKLLDELAEIRRRAGNIPVDMSRIGALRTLLEELRHETEIPPALTERDAQVMALVSQSASIDAIATELNIPSSEVAGVLKDTSARYQRMCNFLSRSNLDRTKLADIRGEELAALRARNNRI